MGCSGACRPCRASARSQAPTRLALGTLILTGLSLRDYVRARVGQAHEMTLRLPATAQGQPWRRALTCWAGPDSSRWPSSPERACLCWSFLHRDRSTRPRSPWPAPSLRARALRSSSSCHVHRTGARPLDGRLPGVSSDRIRRWAQRRTATGKLALTAVFGLRRSPSPPSRRDCGGDLASAAQPRPMPHSPRAT